MFEGTQRHSRSLFFYKYVQNYLLLKSLVNNFLLDYYFLKQQGGGIFTPPPVDLVILEGQQNQGYESKSVIKTQPTKTQSFQSRYVTYIHTNIMLLQYRDQLLRHYKIVVIFSTINNQGLNLSPYDSHNSTVTLAWFQ